MTGEHDYAISASRTVYNGYINVVEDDVVMPDGQTSTRTYIRHMGVVAVVALDDADRIALIRQYRHPVRRRLWEIPAGVRDVAGEPPEVTAARELAEEADLTAGQLEPLLDVYPTPGCSDERTLIYLARDLSEVPSESRHVRGEEEAELTLRWWDLDEAVKAVMSGEIVNGLCVSGVLAAAHHVKDGHSL
ncbi:MAG: NUDIX domain-containing protein [Stackebrandtia sp.]